MKCRITHRVVLMTLMVIAITALLQAQLKVKNSSFTHEDALRDAKKVTVHVPMDFMKDALKDFMQERFNKSVEGLGFLANKDEVAVEQAVIPALGKDPLDLYLKFASLDEHSTIVSIAAKATNSRYLRWKTNQIELDSLGSLLKAYAERASLNYYTDHVKEVQESKDDLINTLEKARADVEDAKKKIQKNLDENEELKKEISELKTHIKVSDKALKRTRTELETSQTRLKVLQR